MIDYETIRALHADAGASEFLSEYVKAVGVKSKARRNAIEGALIAGMVYGWGRGLSEGIDVGRYYEADR